MVPGQGEDAEVEEGVHQRLVPAPTDQGLEGDHGHRQQGGEGGTGRARGPLNLPGRLSYAVRWVVPAVPGSQVPASEAEVMTMVIWDRFGNAVAQDRTWGCSDGGALALEEMTPAHRRSVLVMLERSRDELYLGWLEAEGVVVDPRPAWALDADGLTPRAWVVRGATPWFEALPLIRRLRHLTAGDDD